MKNNISAVTRWLLPAVCGAGLIGGATLATAVQFTVTDLGTVPNYESVVGTSVNNLGQVAGLLIDTNATGKTSAFVWQGGQFTDVGLLTASSYSLALKINSAGQAAGGYTGPSIFPLQAFIAENGHISNLGSLTGGSGAFAFGVNDNGDASGLSFDSTGSSHAVSWHNGTITDLGTLPTLWAIAWRINNGGTAAGFAMPSSKILSLLSGGATLGLGSAFQTGMTPLAWQSNKLSQLKLLVNGGSGMPLDINDAGQIVGQATPLFGGSHAMLWPNLNATPTDLGVLQPFHYSIALGINAAGQIVGAAFNLTATGTFTNESRAVVWIGGQATDLNQLIPTNSGVVLQVATGINASGQILCSGLVDGQSRTLLIIPIETAPEPPTSLTAIAVSPSQINLSWNDNAFVESNVVVERASAADGLWAPIATLDGHVASFADTGLAANVPYFYRVHVSNGSGTSDYSNLANATTAGVFNLAVVSIKAPTKISLSGAKPSITSLASVQIQNLSPHDEVISNAGVLSNLVTLAVQSLVFPCPNLVATPRLPTKFPITLKPKGKLVAAFDVTFKTNCVPNGAATTKTATNDDYRYIATVHHEAIDGNPNSSLPQTICPRPSNGTDPGCGNKNPDKTLGAPVLTDVILKP